MSDDDKVVTPAAPTLAGPDKSLDSPPVEAPETTPETSSETTTPAADDESESPPEEVEEETDSDDNFEEPSSPSPAVAPASEASAIDTIAREVIDGKWGEGRGRWKRLAGRGYNVAQIQARVTEILQGDSPESSVVLPKRVYTVRYGDSLAEIAAKFNVPGGWQAIHNANRGVIGSNPNLIRQGLKLILPS